MTASLRELLAAIASERKDSPLMTEGLRSFAARPSTVQNVSSWLKNMKTFSFLFVENVGQQGMERRGAKVERIWYYKAITGQATQYLAFYLTPDSRVTDIDVTRE
jgi:hypothetical protein